MYIATYRLNRAFDRLREREIMATNAIQACRVAIHIGGLKDMQLVGLRLANA